MQHSLGCLGEVARNCAETAEASRQSTDRARAATEQIGQLAAAVEEQSERQRE